MDELFLPKNVGKIESAELLLATVHTAYTTGVKLTFDGQSEASQKIYRVLRTGSTLRAGDRVVVMKHSGTYVVLGAIIQTHGIIATDTVSDFLTSSSYFTVESGTFARCGNIASIYVYGAWAQTVSTATEITCFTLKSGYRPYLTSLARAWRNANAILYSNGNMTYHNTVTKDNHATFLCTYLLQ